MTQPPVIERTENQEKFVLETARKYPDWWIETITDTKLWIKQKEICRSVAENPRTVVRSCEGSGKTKTAGGVVLWFLNNFDPATVLTTAPTFRQVKDILWREISVSYNAARLDLPGTLTQFELKINDDRFAVGLSTDEPEKFQGYHNRNVLVVGDEASGLGEGVFQAIENPLSTGFTRLLLIGNPTQSVGKFRECFSSPLYNKIHISAFDTPNFTTFNITLDDIKNDTWQQKIGIKDLPYPSLIAPARVAERYKEWGEGAFLFQVFVMGNFPDSGVNNLIPLSVIENAMKAPKDKDSEQSSKVMALDVARYGDDESVLGIRQGKNVLPMASWGHQDTTFTAGRTARYARDNKPLTIRVDATGVGGGVADQLRAAGFDQAEDINVGEKALDTERFANKRAEGYWLLKQKLEDGELCLPDDNKLKAQLADIRFKYNPKGQLLLESKEEMRARGTKSPDRADTLMMLCLPLKHKGQRQVWRW
ncbi:MAG: hypothetical protein WC455_16225 [Dehalococcoidia bacterium]|jgi:hypothetical protein